VNWKYLLALGAIAGGVALAAKRLGQKAQAEADLWSEATDPVARFGDG